MPPEYCPAHSELMMTVGVIKEKAENTQNEVCEIKNILLRWEEEAKTEVVAAAEQKARTKMVWVGLGTAVVAGISAGVHFIIKKLGG